MGWSDENSFLFVVLSIVGGVGLLSFLLLRPVDYDAGSQPPPVDPSKTTLAEVRATFAMVFEKRVLLLIPMFMLCGTISVMWSSWFTRQMEKTVIGLVMPFFALAEILGGIAIGRISDRYVPSLERSYITRRYIRDISALFTALMCCRDRRVVYDRSSCASQIVHDHILKSLTGTAERSGSVWGCCSPSGGARRCGWATNACARRARPHPRPPALTVPRWSRAWTVITHSSTSPRSSSG